MFKKGMDFLARYPRLRVLTFGVGAVVVVGVSMHAFTKKQDGYKSYSMAGYKGGIFKKQNH